MATTVDRAYVHGYSQELYRLVQQSDTKFRQAARVKTGLVGKDHNFDRLGPSDLATVTARHQPVNILNPEHSRRKLNFTDKEGSILLDKFDEVKMLIQPQNQYAMNHAAAINRFYDDIMIAALTGNSTAVDENDATSSVTLASFDSGSHVIANGGTGLTFDKVNQTLRLLNEEDVPYGERYFAVSPQGIEDLLDTPEATSNDFIKQNLTAIQQGNLTIPWMSFNWIMTTRLAVTVGLVRTCIAWHKSALGLGLAIDMATRITQREDLATAPIQVSAWCSAGAVRIEEAKVVQVDILETA